MSQHRSLRIDKVGSRHRNVLKRYERIEKLKVEERWKEGAPVYGLPKVKSQKMKVKKAAKAAAGEPGAPGAAAPATGAAPAAKAPVAAKAPAAKAPAAKGTEAPPKKK
jgi:small basic protein (TIGR04137 family)